MLRTLFGLRRLPHDGAAHNINMPLCPRAGSLLSATRILYADVGECTIPFFVLKKKTANENKTVVVIQVLTGDDNGGYTNITAPDSIVERSAAALKYLGAPWSRYLDPTTNAVRWSDVIIAGHSNGADHAGFLSKNYNVSRALMFAGPNDSVGARGSDGYYSAAPWVYRNWTSNVTGEVATPPERLYGFGVCGYRVTPPPSPLTTTWQVFEDYTNIYDREPSPTNVTHGTLKFVGLFDTATECFAAVNATSAKDGPYHSWTWNDAVKTTSPAYANHCWGDTSMTWQGRGDAPGQVSGRGPGFPANPPPVQHPSDGECWAWLPNWSVAMGMPGPWYKADNVTALADPKTFVGVHHACSSGMVPHGSSGDGYNHMASAADCCMPRFPANFSSPPALAGRILWTNIILNMLTGSPYAAGAGGGGGGGDGGGSSNNTASCACVA